MKMKKILASVAATAVAVSAMATSAFAVGGNTAAFLSTWSGDKVEATGYVFDGAWGGAWTQFTDPNDTTEGLVGPIAIADAANYDVVFEIETEGQVDEDLILKAGDTNTETYSARAVAGATKYTVVFNAADLNTQSSGDYVGFNMQVGSQTKSTVTIYAVAAGTVTASNNAPAAETDAAAEGDTDTATEDKGNADTGAEGVAAVAGLAIVAAGAVIVAKKRK